MNKKRAFLILSLVSFAVSVSIYLLGLLQPFENRAFDLYSRLLNPEEPREKDIVIVSIDQHSIDELSRQGIQWPWPRQIYAPIIEYTSGASALFIDILYTEPSSYGVEDDGLFRDSIKRASNVYLPVFLTNQNRGLTDKDRGFLKRNSLSTVRGTDIMAFKSALLPIEELREGIKGIGNVTISPDDDGVYRRMPLFFRLNDIVIQHFVIPYLFNANIAKTEDGALSIRGKPVPLYNGNVLLRYYKKQRPFQEVSAAEVLQAYSEMISGKKPVLNRDFFKGKTVFMGLTAAGLYDLKPTAVSSLSTGILIHGSLFDNLMREGFFRPIPKALIVSLMLLIALLTTAAAMRYHSIVVNLIFFVSMLSITVMFSALFFAYGFYQDITSLPLTVIISFVVAIAFSYATEGKERRFVKRAFSQYMDEKVVDYLLSHPELIQPGGKKRQVTVFFADIAGFTTISELLSAEDTAKMLRTILNFFTEIIIKHKGVIDKYIGDCVMAFWGSPYSTEEDEALACISAIECMRSLKAINESFVKEGIPEISMRIGINSGTAIAGNLGSDRLFDYTVIGDTVNLASRLEGVNKRFHTQIIASESTVSRAAERIITRYLGSIEVKGKNEAINIYEIMGLKGEVSERDLIKKELFESALSLFMTGQITMALEGFESAASQYPDDRATQMYKQWCEKLVFEDNLTEQSFVIKMSEK